MNIKKYLFFLLVITNNVLADTTKGGKCIAELEFNGIPKSKSQTLKIDENTTLEMNQFLDSYSHNGTEVASNVICQSLEGANYTGSKEEWAGVIKNALDGINAKGATDVKLSLTTELGKIYKGVYNNKEYDFRADFGGNKQVIKNLTVLDLERNTAYTISVSGAEMVEDEIIKEFKRIVGSFKLN